MHAQSSFSYPDQYLGSFPETEACVQTPESADQPTHATIKHRSITGLVESVTVTVTDQFFCKVSLRSTHPATSSCPQIIFILTAFRVLTLIASLRHHLFPLRSKCPPSAPLQVAIRGTRVTLLLPEKFSSKLKTEAKVILTLLTRRAGADK